MRGEPLLPLASSGEFLHSVFRIPISILLHASPQSIRRKSRMLCTDLRGGDQRWSSLPRQL
jgi:hypothetical protein